MIPYRLNPLGISGGKPYQRELAYLESTGQQWIDTGVVSNNLSTRYDVDIAFTGQILQNGRCGLYTSAFGAYNSQWCCGNVYSGGAPVQRDVRYSLSCRNCQLYVDDVYVLQRVYSYTGAQYMFASCNVNGQPQYTDYMRIYAAKIYVDGTLVRDFIPVLDNDSVPCMYDQVTGTCYYNSGTGTFLYGELN